MSVERRWFLLPPIQDPHDEIGRVPKYAHSAGVTFGGGLFDFDRTDLTGPLPGEWFALEIEAETATLDSIEAHDDAHTLAEYDLTLESATEWFNTHNGTDLTPTDLTDAVRGGTL